MGAWAILRDGGAVNGIQRVLALLGCQKIRQILKMIRMICEAGVHIGIGVETGIDIVASSPPPGILWLESKDESPS